MDIASISNISTTYPVTTSSSSPVESVKPIKEVDRDTDIAVIYEQSSDSDKNEDKLASATYENPVEKSKVDQETIDKLKAYAEERTAQLRDLVKKMFSNQGIAFSFEDVTFDTSEKLVSALRNEEYEVPEEVSEQAKKNIADDGYWGVEETSDRLFNFAKALSGGDTSKADDLIDAIKEGFSQAADCFGDELPEICQKTLDATIKKVENWRDGVEETSSST